jgi:hypothetical protein
MPSFKKYTIHCKNCPEPTNYTVFASIYHTIDVDQWMRDKEQNCDCKAISDALAKARAPRPINPIKLSKKKA